MSKALGTVSAVGWVKISLVLGKRIQLKEAKGKVFATDCYFFTSPWDILVRSSTYRSHLLPRNAINWAALSICMSYLWAQSVEPYPLYLHHYFLPVPLWSSTKLLCLPMPARKTKIPLIPTTSTCSDRRCCWMQWSKGCQWQKKSISSGGIFGFGLKAEKSKRTAEIFQNGLPSQIFTRTHNTTTRHDRYWPCKSRCASAWVCELCVRVATFSQQQCACVRSTIPVSFATECYYWQIRGYESNRECVHADAVILRLPVWPSMESFCVRVQLFMITGRVLLALWKKQRKHSRLMMTEFRVAITPHSCNKTMRCCRMSFSPSSPFLPQFHYPTYLLFVDGNRRFTQSIWVMLSRNLVWQ